MSDSKAKTVIVNARFLTQPITGVQRFAIEICLRLKKLLPGAVFVSPKNILHHEVALVLEVQQFGRCKSHIWEQLELPLYLKKRGNPLLLNLCNTAPLLYTNNVVCIHDLSFLINPAWFSRSFATIYTFLIPRIAKKARKVLTVSEYSKQSIHRLLHVPKAEIEVIYNAVSTEVFSATGKAAQHQYGKYILAVGSLDPRKNLKRLFKAFISCRLPDAKLLIVGAASKIFKDVELQQLVEDNKAIVLTGYLEDKELRQLYQHASLFVYPSLYEGFGIPPLEAMQSGCATLVSNVSSLPEVCANASYYVNPERTEEIAAGIKLLMENDEARQSLIQEGFERSKCFSWELSSNKLVRVLEAIE